MVRVSDEGRAAGEPAGEGDADLALKLAEHTDHLVFGPAFAARHALRRGALVEVKIRGWAVKQPLYVLCNSDRVLSRVQRSIVRTMKKTLGESSNPD